MRFSNSAAANPNKVKLKFSQVVSFLFIRYKVQQLIRGF